MIQFIPNEEYHSEKEHLSSSSLKRAIDGCPRDVFFYEPVSAKNAFTIGNAFESLLCEDGWYAENIVVYDEAQRPEKDKTMRSKANQEWKASLGVGKEVISPSDKRLLDSMLAEAKKNADGLALLQKALSTTEKLFGYREQLSIFWEDTNGLKVKTRPDLCVFDAPSKTVTIIDIKTSQVASPNGFARSACNLHYPFQATMQVMGLEAAGWELDEYYYWVTSKERFPKSVLYRLSMADLERGRKRYDSVSKQVRGYLDGKVSGTYKNGTLDIPKWYW
jgi:hypothetical protein